MKISAVAFLALACLVAMTAAAGYGYGYPATQGGAGSGYLLPLIGLLFLMMVLFGLNSGTESIVLVNVTE